MSLTLLARLWLLVTAVLSLSAYRDVGPVSVPAGASLQQAIDRARPGDTLLLTPGATYTGNFVLPARAGDRYITIRTGGEGDGLPRSGQRVLPVHAPRLAKLKSPNREPVLRTVAGAHHWRLELLEFLPTESGFGDIIRLGDGGSDQHELSQVPHDLVVDRCYVHGDEAAGQKRGIALNSASTTITNSYISDIKAVAQDTQAIGGWNGPGPYTIENNYLEGAGENFLLGGSDPSIPGLVTADVVFRRNHLAKPVAWRNERWQVKNLFELKNARRVLVEGNLMEYVWQQAQVGYAILLTPRNQDGRAPWVTVEDVTIRRNIVRHAGGAMQIIGEDSNHPSGSTRRVKVVDNLFYGVDAGAWGGTGAFVLIGEGPSDITIAAQHGQPERQHRHGVRRDEGRAENHHRLRVPRQPDPPQSVRRARLGPGRRGGLAQRLLPRRGVRGQHDCGRRCQTLPEGQHVHRRGRLRRGVRRSPPPATTGSSLPAASAAPPRMGATSAPTSSRLRQALGLRPRPQTPVSR